jgi:hypothetical protein
MVQRGVKGITSHGDSIGALGRHYGIDVAAEILHKGKSVSAVLSMIAEKARVPDRRRS